MIRWMMLLILGGAMFVLGAVVALRPLVSHRPFTGALWLDMTFALLFLLRGWLNIKTALKRRAAANAGAT